MLQLCLAQKIDGTNRPVYVTSSLLLSPKGLSVKRGVRAGPGAGVGVGVYPVYPSIFLPNKQLQKYAAGR